MRKQWSAVTLGLVLVACGQQTTNPGGNPNPGPDPTPNLSTVSGNVTVSAPLASAGVAAQALPEAGALLAQAQWSAPRVKGQLLVLDDPAAALGAQGLSALSALAPQRVTDTLSVVRTPAGESDEALAARLSAAGVRVQPNYVYKALAVPNDPGYPGPNNAGVPVDNDPTGIPNQRYTQDNLTRINALGAWNYLESVGKSAALQGVKVAVLDTGINAGHEDLAGRVYGGGRDFCAQLVNDACQGEDADPSEVQGPDRGHGTSSSGLIAAATNNSKGIAGLTWSGQTILPVKVLGTNGTVTGADTVSLTKGINYAVSQGAKVINMSLGFQGGNSDTALKSAISAAAQADVVLVAAAGNTPNDGLYYPAADGAVLAVGAFGASNALACYSARPSSGQKALDLVAPGGAGEVGGQCYRQSPDDIVTLSATAYTLRAGTSEAAPQVSGVTALMRAANPKLTQTQIRELLRSSATVVGGQRLLNAEAAVKAAVNAQTTTPPPPTPNTYTLTVQAVQGSNVVSTYQNKVQGGASSYAYTLPPIPNGTYTFKATITGNGKNLTGSVNRAVQSDVSGVNIAVK